MLTKFVIVAVLICYFGMISFSLHLDGTSLIKLIKAEDHTIEGLGFINTKPKSEATPNPFSSHLPEICKRVGITGRGKRLSFSSYPKFQRIYNKCQQKFKKNSTCLATCIFYEIIKRKEYGRLFLLVTKGKDNLYVDPTLPFPHYAAYDFHSDDNIFCFSKEFRSILLKNMYSCKLFSSTEFCIIDEEGLLCDPHLGNCDFVETEASVITSGNKAHIVTCGTIDALNWKYFDKSSKLQCILPGKSRLLEMQRKVFKDCRVCSNQVNDSVIEFLTVPTKEEFSKVAYSARPIIIRNGTANDRIPRLNFSAIKEIYQDFLVGDWKPCKLNLFFSPFDNFSHALTKLSEDIVSKPWYLVWGICEEEMRNRFGNAVKKPSFLPDDYPKAKEAPWVYSASVGDGVFPHYDYFRKLTWQAQLSGDKTWFLRPPPECSHICTESFDVTIKQGDFFGIQTNTWIHGTSVEDGDPSIVILTDYEIKDNN